MSLLNPLAAHYGILMKGSTKCCLETMGNVIQYSDAQDGILHQLLFLSPFSMLL